MVGFTESEAAPREAAPREAKNARVESPIKPRRMDFDFGGDIPRYWFSGSPAATHIANSLCMLFPLGERFFVRSVKAFLDRVDDPALLADVRGFIAQEVRHGAEHQRAFEVLREQGYSIDRFLAFYEAFAYKFIERITPKKLHLATTVALEHFTATLAERALAGGFMLEEAHPAMRDLLLWHAAEEIEHKSVAFDVLQKVDSSYALRMAGLVMATWLLVGLGVAGAIMLMAQDKGSSPRLVLRHLRAGVKRKQLGDGSMWRAMVAYMRRGFHPNDIDNAGLARSYFEGLRPAAAE